MHFTNGKIYDGDREISEAEYEAICAIKAKEIIAESNIPLVGHASQAHWSRPLILKFLRPYSLGAGLTSDGHRAKYRYRRGDIARAWIDTLQLSQLSAKGRYLDPVLDFLGSEGKLGVCLDQIDNKADPNKKTKQEKVWEQEQEISR